MGSPTLTARYVPRRLVPQLLTSLALAAVGLVTGLIGVIMGWILAVIMLWTVATTVTRMRRREPVITLDAAGVTDHRIPRAVRWDEVEAMRTVDRRVVLIKIPLLELIPTARRERDGKAMLGAVVRGDIAFIDARDDDRVIIDLNHLDRTPEEILGIARTLRTT